MTAAPRTERMSEGEFKEWWALDGGSALYAEARRAREAEAAKDAELAALNRLVELYGAERDKAEAEIERLKAALREIKGSVAPWAIARAALEEGEK